MRSTAVEPESQQGEARPEASRGSLARFLGVAALGLTVMSLSAGSAWWIRSRGDTSPFESGPRDEGAGPVRRTGDALPSRLKVGRLVYQVQCARCHGPEGRGDGPDAAVLRPAPRDFATRPWSHGESVEAVRSVILQGVPGTSMTGWGHLLASDQVDAVADYILTFRAPAPAPAPASEPLALPKARWQQAGFAPIDPPRPAPAITVHDLNGQARTLDQERGKGVLLVFWGTTCAPCLDELPALDQLAAEFGPSELAVLPICVGEADETTVREVAGPRVQNLPLFIDRTGLAQLRYDVQTLPCAVLIDRNGQLLGRAEGGRDWKDPRLRETLRAVARPSDGDTAARPNNASS